MSEKPYKKRVTPEALDKALDRMLNFVFDEEPEKRYLRTLRSKGIPIKNLDEADQIRAFYTDNQWDALID